MSTNKERDKEHGKEHLAMNTPPIVSQQEWEAARQQLLVKEKAFTRSRDALAAERRRMPWLAVDKKYEFDGPKGKVSLLDLFEGRRQLIVYRAFFEPGVFGWPEHACRGCSLGADQVAHLAHLNARDTTLAYASRAPQADIARLKARMGWEMPWYTMTDSFDADFGVDEWHGHNVFFRDGEQVFRTYFINNRGDEAMGTTWSYLDITPLGRQETWEDSPEGYPQTPPYKWWNWHDNYDAEASPDPKWVDIITDPQGAAPEGATQRRKRAKEGRHFVAREDLSDSQRQTSHRPTSGPLRSKIMTSCVDTLQRDANKELLANRNAKFSVQSSSLLWRPLSLATGKDRFSPMPGTKS